MGRFGAQRVVDQGNRVEGWTKRVANMVVCGSHRSEMAMILRLVHMANAVSPNTLSRAVDAITLSLM